MNVHPPGDRMEAVAAGDRDAAVEAHLASCDACRAYVGRLEEAAVSFRKLEVDRELFLGKLKAAAAVRPAAQTRGSRSWVIYLGAPVLAVAAALALWVRAPDVDVRRPYGVSSVRLKGVVALAVIRDRGGQQERLTGEVTVRAGDRLRVEVDLDRPLPIAGGVLGSDGAWVSLFSPTILEAGSHFSEQAVRFDDRPTTGWVVVGDPAAVDRARATRSFEEVTALQVRIEPE